MKKMLIAIFALGLLVFSTPSHDAQVVNVAAASIDDHPIHPPV